MLRILGSPKRLCNGVTRRELLVAGGLGLGLGPAALLAPASATAAPNDATHPPSFGRAKNVILLYLFGGPSHLEFCDPKPQAPVEVRGELKSIQSALHGCDVCEQLPRVARVLDHVTVVRSLSHPWNFHGVQWATTGMPESSIPLEETQRNPLHWPFLGSVATYLRQRAEGPKSASALPDNLILPFLLSSKRPAISYARPHAAYLSDEFNPVWSEFRGKATRSMVRMSHGPAAEIFDPYLGITREGRFEITPDAELPADMTLDRLDRRRSLLSQVDDARRRFDDAAAVRDLSRHRQTAYSLLNSLAIRQAFDLGREPERLRETYGMTLFGQAALQARRLVEAGCRFVTVIWDEYGQLNAGWDTHVDHYNRLKNDLLPGFDMAYSALIADLDSRGMLDETLVLVMNEMGRTPKLQGNGRGHWGRAYTNLLAGGGVKRGTVVGKTDPIGGEPVERPLTAKDILSTIYHLLGIERHTLLTDRVGRPVPLVAYGDVIPEILG